MTTSMPWPFVLYIALAVITSTVVHNTTQYSDLLDAGRYLEILNLNMDLNMFVFLTNFIIFSLIGGLIYDATKSWKFTLIALLGFSVSLMVYSNLLAQAAVMIICLWLWTERNVGNLYDDAVYIAAFFVCMFLHKIGWAVVLMVYFAKLLAPHLEGKWIKLYSTFHAHTFTRAAVLLALVGFACVGIVLLTQVFPLTAHLEFFYYFLIPISLGAYNMIYWYILFGMILWMLLACKDNTSELLVAAFSFFAACIYFFMGSGLEIDIWRMLIFFEMVAWIRIAKSQDNEFTKWVPIFFLLMGIERLIVGLIV